MKPWDRVIGHRENIYNLRSLAARDRLPHALLFAGISGIGKAVVAEALSEVLLCLNSEDGNSCGSCKSCVALANGNHPDLYRVVPDSAGKSAAKSIKIEQVRELTDRVSMSPSVSSRSVAIIEDAETMRVEAANAILKTIEEPDAAVTFIMITSAPAFLLDTIRSRCMRMDFGIVLAEDVERAIEDIVSTSEMASAVSHLSGGSIGRARELAGDRLSGLRKWAENLLFALPDIDDDAVWRLGNEAENDKWSREDAREAINFLAMMLRDALAMRFGVVGDDRLFNSDISEKIRELLPVLPAGKIVASLRLAAMYQQRFRANVNLRLALESFLLRAAEIFV